MVKRGKVGGVRNGIHLLHPRKQEWTGLILTPKLSKLLQKGMYEQTVMKFGKKFHHQSVDTYINKAFEKISKRVLGINLSTF